MTINLIKAEAEFDRVRAQFCELLDDVPLLERAALYHAALSGSDTLIQAVPGPMLRACVLLALTAASIDMERAKQIGAEA